MRDSCKLSSILLIWVLVTIAGCSGKEDVVDVIPTTSIGTNESFAKLCNSIDSINNEYTLKSDKRNIKAATLNKWGGKVFLL